MKKFAIIIFSLLALSVGGQTISNTKYLNFPSTSYVINLSSNVDIYSIGGAKTLSAAYAVTVTGTPINGMKFSIYYDGSSVTSAGYYVNIMGVVLAGTTSRTTTTTFATGKYIFDCVYNGTTAAWDVRCTPDVNVTHWIQPGMISPNLANDSNIFLNSGYQFSIKPLSLVNALFSASAGILTSKLEALTPSRLIVTDGSGIMLPSSVTSTEAGYLGGVTSAIQTQMNAKTTSGSILQTDFSSAIVIPYAYLSLTNSIVAADIKTTAAIPYSKTSLTNSILDADIYSAAAIARTKMAAQTASRAMVTDGSGYPYVSPVTAAELSYLAGVTSSIQAQLGNAASAPVSYTTISSNTALLPTTLKGQTWVNTTSGAVTVYIPRPDSVAAGTQVTFTAWATNGATLHTYNSYAGFKKGTANATVTYDVGSANGDFVTLVSDGTYWVISKALTEAPE